MTKKSLNAHANPRMNRRQKELMIGGKAVTASKIMSECLIRLRVRYSTTKPENLIIFVRNSLMPVLETSTIKRGGASHQVPHPVHVNRRESLAVRWLVQGAKRRTHKKTNKHTKCHGMAHGLALEIMSVYKDILVNSMGGVIGRKLIHVNMKGPYDKRVVTLSTFSKKARTNTSIHNTMTRMNSKTNPHRAKLTRIAGKITVPSTTVKPLASLSSSRPHHRHDLILASRSMRLITQARPRNRTNTSPRRTTSTSHNRRSRRVVLQSYAMKQMVAMHQLAKINRVFAHRRWR